MVKPYEILVIVILVLTIVLAHSVPVIANEFYIPWMEQQLEVIKFKTNLDNKIGNKYYNVFEDSALSTLIFDSENTEESEDTKCNRISGDIVVDDELKTKVSDIFDLKNDHLIYLIKSNDLGLEQGKLEMMYNFDGKLKEAKSIWYCYVNLNWKFKNKWLFRDINNDIYCSPENNCIIEFLKDDIYSQSPLISDEPKYYIVIVNF